MKKLLGSLILALVPILMSIVPASAGYGTSGVNCDVVNAACYSQMWDAENRTVYGVWMQSTDVTLDAGDGLHVNNTIWLTTSDNVVLEIGSCESRYTSGTCIDGTHPGQYYHYVAVNGRIDWQSQPILSQTQHTYSIMSSGWNGTAYPWHFYLDGILVDTYYDKNTRSTNANGNVATGGEFESATSLGITGNDITGGWSDYVQLEYTDTSWHAWTSWTTGAFGIWEPCGSNGWSPPNCMNGTSPSQSVWNWNIPG